jgi:hypothetical protein
MRLFARVLSESWRTGRIATRTESTTVKKERPARITRRNCASYEIVNDHAMFATLRLLFLLFRYNGRLAVEPYPTLLTKTKTEFDLHNIDLL